MKRASISGKFVDVIDIRHNSEATAEKSLRDEILDSLTNEKPIEGVREDGLTEIQWTKSLPTRVLYEGQGIHLYDNITRDPQYYLYSEELSIFQNHGDETVTISKHCLNQFTVMIESWATSLIGKLGIGPSISHVPPQHAAGFLRKFTAEDVFKLDDILLIGLDRRRNTEKARAAYSESLDCWQAYIRNGTRNAGSILGEEATSKLNCGLN